MCVFYIPLFYILLQYIFLYNLLRIYYVENTVVSLAKVGFFFVCLFVCFVLFCLFGWLVGWVFFLFFLVFFLIWQQGLLFLMTTALKDLTLTRHWVVNLILRIACYLIPNVEANPETSQSVRTCPACKHLSEAKRQEPQIHRRPKARDKN